MVPSCNYHSSFYLNQGAFVKDAETSVINQTKNKSTITPEDEEKKVVRFSTVVTVTEHLHILDFSPQEKKSCWYNREEFRELRSEIRLIAEMLKHNLFVDEERYSLRGLEDRLHLERRIGTKSQMRYAARLAVLSEQDIQQDLCVTNESMIRNVYIQHSHSCAVAALHRGQRDEKEARSLDNIIHDVTRMEIICVSAQQMPTKILVSLAA